MDLRKVWEIKGNTKKSREILGYFSSFHLKQAFFHRFQKTEPPKKLSAKKTEDLHEEKTQTIGGK